MSLIQERRSSYTSFTIKTLIVCAVFFGSLLLTIKFASDMISTELKQSSFVQKNLPKISEDIRWLSDPTYDIPAERKEKIVSRLQILNSLMTNVKTLSETELSVEEELHS